jgi:hypothetical protein
MVGPAGKGDDAMGTAGDHKGPHPAPHHPPPLRKRWDLPNKPTCERQQEWPLELAGDELTQYGWVFIKER